MFGYELSQEERAKREIEWEKREIKKAIIETAVKYHSCLLSLTDDLIAAFDRVNQHYQKDETIKVSSITFNQPCEV